MQHVLTCLSRVPACPILSPYLPPTAPPGVALAGSNTLAGHLADYTKARGLGVRGCFGGAAAACVLAMAVLAAFSTFGDLGREDLVGVKRA